MSKIYTSWKSLREPVPRSQRLRGLNSSPATGLSVQKSTDSEALIALNDLFRKVNVGTEDNPLWAIKAMYSLFSEGSIAAGGYSSGGQGGGGISSIIVNGATAPEVEGVVTLPSYYTQAQADARYVLASGLTAYLTKTEAQSTYQPLNAALTAISALTGNGLLRHSATGWTIDTATYLTQSTADTRYVTIATTQTITGAKTFSAKLSATNQVHTGNLFVDHGTVFDLNRDGSTGDRSDSNKLALEIESYADSIRFKTYAASAISTTHLVLSSTGRVGIGVVPNAKLHVAGGDAYIDGSLAARKHLFSHPTDGMPAVRGGMGYGQSSNFAVTGLATPGNYGFGLYIVGNSTTNYSRIVLTALRDVVLDTPMLRFGNTGKYLSVDSQGNVFVGSDSGVANFYATGSNSAGGYASGGGGGEGGVSAIVINGTRYIPGDDGTVTVSAQLAPLSALDSYLTIQAAQSGYQPLNANLTAIAALTGNGLLRHSATGWSIDTTGYLPLSGGEMTGSIFVNRSTSIIPLVRNIYGFSSTVWERKLASIQVDDVDKFFIGAYGSYTAGGDDNGISYAYIGCNPYSGLNLRISATDLKWGTNDILHTGNYSTTLDSRYLRLTGGTISGTSTSPLKINTTATNIYLDLQLSGTASGRYGFGAGTLGVYLQNLAVTGTPYVNIASDGVFKYKNANPFYHSGNSNLATVNWQGYDITAAHKLVAGSLGVYQSDAELMLIGSAQTFINRGGADKILDFFGTNVRFRNTGNVGIGVGGNAPTEKLHVVGNILATGSVLSGNHYIDKGTLLDLNRNGSTGDIFDSSKAGLEIETYANAVKFKTYNSTVSSANHLVLSNGNVGIGVVPTVRLHLASGDAYIDGSVASRKYLFSHQTAAMPTMRGAMGYGSRSDFALTGLATPSLNTNAIHIIGSSTVDYSRIVLTALKDVVLDTPMLRFGNTGKYISVDSQGNVFVGSDSGVANFYATGSNSAGGYSSGGQDTGGVSKIIVNGSEYTPTSEGVLTLPDYPTTVTTYPLTIKRNGTAIGTYNPTTSAQTVNLTVPTKVTDLSDAANYLTTSAAASTYQPKSTDLSAIAALTGNGLLRHSATGWSIDTTSYLSTSSAASTYQTISGMSSYLTTSAAQNTYLRQTDAATVYLGKTEAQNTYLRQTDAASLYVTISGAAQTISSAKTFSSNLTANAKTILGGASANQVLNVKGTSDFLIGNGSTSIDSSVYAMVVGIYDEYTTAPAIGRYYPGIAFTHLTNGNNYSTYRDRPQAWIGTKLVTDAVSGYKTALVFATRNGGLNNTTTYPVERMSIAPDGLVTVGMDSGVLETNVILQVLGSMKVASRLYIGNTTSVWIEYDSTNQAIKVNGNFYATGSNSAGGYAQ